MTRGLGAAAVLVLAFVAVMAGRKSAPAAEAWLSPVGAPAAPRPSYVAPGLDPDTYKFVTPPYDIEIPYPGAPPYTYVAPGLDPVTYKFVTPPYDIESGY